MKHRQRLPKAEQKAYDAALDWARMGTNAVDETVVVGVEGQKKVRVSGTIRDGRYWARTSDPQLVELVLSQLS